MPINPARPYRPATMSGRTSPPLWFLQEQRVSRAALAERRKRLRAARPLHTQAIRGAIGAPFRALRGLLGRILPSPSVPARVNHAHAGLGWARRSSRRGA